jgi:hypothetical protein
LSCMFLIKFNKERGKWQLKKNSNR